MKTRLSIFTVALIAAFVCTAIGISLGSRKNYRSGERPSSKQVLSDFAVNNAHSINTNAFLHNGETTVNLNTGTFPSQVRAFARVGALTLDPGEDGLHSAAIDPNRTFAYFGTFTSPGQVVKVRLSDFTRVGVLTLNPGETGVQSAVIDPTGGFGYFATSFGGAGTVVKVRLSDLTRVGTLIVNTGSLLTSAVIDASGGFAYFGTESRNLVAKVRLSDLTRVGCNDFVMLRSVGRTRPRE